MRRCTVVIYVWYASPQGWCDCIKQNARVDRAHKGPARIMPHFIRCSLSGCAPFAHSAITSERAKRFRRRPNVICPSTALAFPGSAPRSPHPRSTTCHKMGFLQSTILGSVSFLLGIVFVCQIPDIPLLYRALTPDALDNAYTFYLMWFDAPRAVKAVLHAALGLPLLPLIAKLNGWSESAVFFDGSSLGKSAFFSSVVQSLTMICTAVRQCSTSLP